MKKSKISITVFAFSAFLLALTAFILCLIFTPFFKTEKTSIVFSPSPCVIIDAGHGGKDGGALACDGTYEKDINLDIALTLADIMKLCGYDVILTRSDDSMLTTDENTGSDKMRDLKQRLIIASQYPDAVFVSIHCNKFSSENCKGMQVYYSENEMAQNIALSIQNTIKNQLQKDNTRKIKKADSSIYLLNRAKIPSVLIECGFISNKEDTLNLKDKEYQKKLSFLIMTGISKIHS